MSTTDEAVIKGLGMHLNKELAQTLGWTDLFNTGGSWLGKPPEGTHECRGQAMVPDWAGNSEACMALAADHEVLPSQSDVYLTLSCMGVSGKKKEFFLDAYRQTIVREVIRKITSIVWPWQNQPASTNEPQLDVPKIVQGADGRDIAII